MTSFVLVASLIASGCKQHQPTQPSGPTTRGAAKADGGHFELVRDWYNPDNPGAPLAVGDPAQSIMRLVIDNDSGGDVSVTASGLVDTKADQLSPNDNRVFKIYGRVQMGGSVTGVSVQINASDGHGPIATTNTKVSPKPFIFTKDNPTACADDPVTKNNVCFALAHKFESVDGFGHDIKMTAITLDAQDGDQVTVDSPDPDGVADGPHPLNTAARSDGGQVGFDDRLSSWDSQKVIQSGTVRVRFTDKGAPNPPRIIHVKSLKLVIN